MLTLGGYFDVWCYGSDGELKWYESTANLVVNEGLYHALDVMLTSGTQHGVWYLGIFESDTTPSAAATYASPGYTESTAYDEATRPEYVETRTAASVDNSASKGTFTINATKTIYGAFLVGGGTDADTKGDTAGGGTLLCASKFASSRAVVDDDVLQVQYTFTAADDGV